MTQSSSDFLDHFADNPLHKNVTYKKGEVVFSPLDEAEICNVVVSGFVRVHTIDKQGVIVVQNFCSTGDIFPLSWIIDKPNTSVFWDAMTSCTIARIPQAEVARVIAADAKAASLMMKQVTEQFFVYANLVGNLSFKYGSERLAYRLLILAHRFGKQVANNTNWIVLPNFSQQDLGSTIKMSRENTSRELSKLERAGIIAHRKGRIVILDLAALRSVIGGENDTFYFDK